VKAASDAVNRRVTVAITQDEHDALADFVFNCGIGALTGSTLLKDLNAGDFAGAAEQFDRQASSGPTDSVLQPTYRKHSEGFGFSRGPCHARLRLTPIARPR